MSSSRDIILARVRDALAPLPKRAPLPDWDRDLVILREAHAGVDRWNLFSERLRLVNGRPLNNVNELVAYLTEKLCCSGVRAGLQGFPAQRPRGARSSRPA